MDPASMAVMALGGSALSGVGNILSTIFTNKANKQNVQDQQNFAYDMWNKQNAYNTPEAQMERYKAAGLNPNLIYGSGSASAGNAGPVSIQSPAHYNAPVISLPDIGQIMNQYQDYKLKSQGIETARWNTAAARQNAIDLAYTNFAKWGTLMGRVEDMTPNGDLMFRFGDPLNVSDSIGAKNIMYENYMKDLQNKGQILHNYNVEQDTRLKQKLADSFYYKMVMDGVFQAAGQASKFLY